MEKPTESLTAAEIEEQFQSVRHAEVELSDFVMPGDWDQVHQEGWTWEGNLPGFISHRGDVVALEFRGLKDNALADHLLGDGGGVRFGHPVTWEIKGTEHVYQVHTERPGIALYQGSELANRPVLGRIEAVISQFTGVSLDELRDQRSHGERVATARSLVEIALIESNDYSMAEVAQLTGRREQTVQTAMGRTVLRSRFDTEYAELLEKTRSWLGGYRTRQVVVAPSRMATVEKLPVDFIERD